VLFAAAVAVIARLEPINSRGRAMSRGICLVIEDDEDIAGLISVILTREGFDVRSVRTASAALHQLRGINPALITLDLGLPDLDGLQIAKDLRELSAAPVLMITARASATDQFNGMAAGAAAYLVKPFHPSELRVAVASLCPARSAT
jgi:two-component system OmpR family response regulator